MPYERNVNKIFDNLFGGGGGNFVLRLLDTCSGIRALGAPPSDNDRGGKGWVGVTGEG